MTEAITGQDLVEWQLLVSAGQPLPLTQEQLRLRGHAFEARLYAESPERDFMPGTGTVRHWRVPAGAVFFTHQGDVRVDSGVQQGDEVRRKVLGDASRCNHARDKRLHGRFQTINSFKQCEISMCSSLRLQHGEPACSSLLSIHAHVAMLHKLSFLSRYVI